MKTVRKLVFLNGKPVIRTAEKVHDHVSSRPVYVYSNNAPAHRVDTDRIRPYLSQYNGEYSLRISETVRARRLEEMTHQSAASWQKSQQSHREAYEAISWMLPALSRMSQQASDF
jgi:hypothetical protein